MKYIKPSTLRDMFGLWLAYLLFLVVMHIMQPNDPWVAMFFRPASLIFAPLLVACIPLFAVKPEQNATMDSVRGESATDRTSGPAQSGADTVRRMTLVWLMTLVIFASPHPTATGTGLDTVLHHPAFLLVAPLLLACIPLLRPATASRRIATHAKASRQSRSQIWIRIITNSFVIFLDICWLVTVNSYSPRGGGSKWGENLILGLVLIFLLVSTWNSIKLLAKSN